MRNQISITVDEEVLRKIRGRLKDGTYRNQSHLFEFAVRKLLDDENGN